MPESCHYLTALDAHSHPCLVSLLFIPSLYSTFFNLNNFLFTCYHRRRKQSQSGGGGGGGGGHCPRGLAQRSSKSSRAC